MLKRILINIVLAFLLFLMLMFAAFEGDFATLNLVDGLFITGFVVASFGILTLSQVSKMFRGLSFSLKKMFMRKYDGITYYDYLQMKGDNPKEKPTGYAGLIVGALIIIASIIISNSLL